MKFGLIIAKNALGGQKNYCFYVEIIKFGLILTIHKNLLNCFQYFVDYVFVLYAKCLYDGCQVLRLFTRNLLTFYFYTSLKMCILVIYGFDRGGTQYKRPYGAVPSTWVAKSASCISVTPYFMQTIVYEWVIFPKFSKIWAKIG